ncbi:MAG: general secretion pathway protein GspE, partial [Planctomycetes bacterium]|nr:general secretion pathway protein GspE [Planctomycetota bacterium]
MALDVYKDWLGIPEGPRPPDHYQLLRLVQFEDDTEKIRKNYKKLNTFVRKYATGQYSNESQVLLNELAKAMLCLTDEEQKLEYDKSLGREIDDRDEATGRRPLTAFLLDDGVLTSDQVKEVKSHSERAGLSVRDALVQLKLADAEVATRALAKELGRSYVDLADMLPDDSVLDQIPRSVVRRHTCLPLFVDNGAVLVACADEPETELEDEIRLRFNMPVRPVLATPLAINQGIAKYYSAGLRKEAPEPTNSSKATPTKKKSAVPSAPLSEGEKEQRKQFGIVAMCLSFALFSLLDTFFLYDKYYKRMGLPEMVPFSGILIGVPLATFFFLTMVRKK